MISIDIRWKERLDWCKCPFACPAILLLGINKIERILHMIYSFHISQFIICGNIYFPHLSAWNAYRLKLNHFYSLLRLLYNVIHECAYEFRRIFLSPSHSSFSFNRVKRFFLCVFYMWWKYKLKIETENVDCVCVCVLVNSLWRAFQQHIILCEFIS